MSGAPDREPVGTRAEIRVLHVDDDPDFADLTASFLEHTEVAFDVTSATDPTDALELFREGRFDCVVSDYDMPGRSGLELLAEVREIDPDIPFVLFTGKGSEEIASRAISAGVTDYLQKSVGTDQYTVLANRIRNAVETYRSREALAASQERLSRFIDQSPLGTIEYDETFTIVRVNDAASEITGYDPEELVGGTWLPIVPESEYRNVAAIERALREDQGGYRSVNEIVTSGGERRWTTWHNRVVTDDDGEVISVFSQFEDITEEYERRQALERSTVLRSTLFEMLPVGVLAENADREVIRINDRLLDLFGVEGDSDDVVGADCEALAADLSDRFVDPEGFVERIEDLIDGGEPVWNEELVLAGGDAVERSYRPVELPGGPGHLWVYYDVSDRRERERRLSRQNARLEEFASVVSHDLRNPLNVAAGRLELAREECDSDHLRQVERAHDRMTELIEDLLTIAREHDAGVDPVPVDLDAFVRDCWANVGTGRGRIVVRADRRIRADEARLKRLLENLLRNSVEHGSTGDRAASDDPEVTVTVGELGNGFYVADDGDGIPPEERDSIFEYGYTTTPDGTGLGLAIVEQCVAAHGWEIDVTEGTDGGARFEITGVEFVAES